MPTLTLGDLLDHRDLGLELVSSSPDARARSVVGAHSIEIQQPARWVPEDWVILTTGVQLRSGSMDSRELIADIAEGGLSALGFGVGLEFNEVPPELLDEAMARDFPVFSIPLPTPFREIVDFVNRSLLSTDLYTLRRVVSMQSFLMDALYEPRPREAVIERLGSLLQGSAIMFTLTGAVEITTGRAPASQIWKRIAAGGEEQMSFSLHGWSVVAAPVIAGGVTNGWLAVGFARARNSSQVARQVVRAASRILGLVSTAQRIAVAEERVLGAALVRDLVLAPTVDGTVAARAAALGFAAEGSAYVAVIEPLHAPPEGSLDTVLVAVQRWLASRGVPYAAALEGQRIVLIVQAPITLVEEWVATPGGTEVGLRVGLGRVTPTLLDVAASWREAESALRHLAAEGNDGTTSRSLRADELDLSDWLVVQRDMDVEVAHRKARALLAPLAGHATLQQSLRTYLDCHLNVNQAAKRLHLHPNSLRYRLRRIEDSLGRALDDPATLANLHLAFLMERETIGRKAES